MALDGRADPRPTSCPAGPSGPPPGPAARGAAGPPCQARHQPYPARPSRRLPQTRMLGSPTIPRQRPGPLHPASTTRTSLHLHPDFHASLQAEEREPRCPVWPCHTADPCDTSQKQSCSPIRPCCTPVANPSGAAPTPSSAPTSAGPQTTCGPATLETLPPTLISKATRRAAEAQCSSTDSVCAAVAALARSVKPRTSVTSRLASRRKDHRRPSKSPPPTTTVNQTFYVNFPSLQTPAATFPELAPPLLGHPRSWERRRYRIEPSLRRPEGRSCEKRPSQLPCPTSHRPRRPSCYCGAGLAQPGAGLSLRTTTPARRRSPRQAATPRARPPAG